MSEAHREQPEPMNQYNVRVPRWMWQAAAARARREGQSLSEVIRHFLRGYAAGQAESDTE